MTKDIIEKINFIEMRIILNNIDLYLKKKALL